VTAQVFRITAPPGIAPAITIVPPYGGELLIEWRSDEHVIMTGPAQWEWSGRLDPATGAWSRDAAEADAA
jgi:diaminopimelate epimerase